MLSVIYAVSFMLCVIYAMCHLCYVSFMLSVIYAECHLCYVPFMLCVIYAVCSLLCVTNKPFTLGVVMANVVVLNVMAPFRSLSR